MPAPKGLERIYKRELKKELKKLNSTKWLIPFSKFYTTFFLVALISVVFSFLIGFLGSSYIGTEQTDAIAKPILYVLAYVAIFWITYERLLNQVSINYHIFRRKMISIVTSIIISALVYAISWYLGTNILGNELDLKLFKKIGNMLLLMGIMSIPYFIFIDFERKFLNKYKYEVFRRITSLHDITIEYNTQDRIGSSTFAKSKLFPAEEISHYSGSDKFVGKYKDVRFEFCHINSYQYKKIVKRIEILPLFKGVLYRAQMKKHFYGQAVVPSKQIRSGFGSSLNEVLNNALNRTDIRFQKAFTHKEHDIYSTDSDEARSFFDEEFFHLILKLKEKFSSDISCAYADDYLYIAIPLEKDYFAPELNKNLDDYDKLQDHLIEVQKLIEIVDDLKLNEQQEKMA